MSTFIPKIFVPPPVVAGIDCPHGWGVDRLFGDNPTPSKLWVSILGVIKSGTWVPGDGEPGNSLFELNQKIGFPCQFDNAPASPFCLIEFFADRIQIVATTTTGFAFFLDVDSPPERRTINGDPLGRFDEGSAVISIPKVLP